ncbi:MAG: R2-like ligand-binding oxidase [Actinomycetota bacterium]|nr:R2-like ligand-binding oxidase [Actinomycetota bacterium]
MTEIDAIVSPDLRRKASEWTSPKGLHRESVPMRLWEKAKKGFWDPADLDFRQDRADWEAMDLETRISVFRLARGFMVGEEGVTLDILPLMMGLSDQGRLEEVMYLSTFAMEEAKHVDFFRLWFDETGVDDAEMNEILVERARARGVEIDMERDEGMFESELPKAMRAAASGDDALILNASVTYNQFVEGCLALSGYTQWSEIFGAFGVLPGLQEGLRLIRKDEGRHITYGTYLCQRILASRPELLDQATSRLAELRDMYFSVEVPAEELDETSPSDQVILDFRNKVAEQVSRRTKVLEKAAGMSPEEVVTSESAEQAEFELALAATGGG